MEINLTFNEEHFRQAYFAGKDYRLHKHPSTKSRFYVAATFFFITLLLGLLLLLGAPVNGLFVFSLVVFAVSCLTLVGPYTAIAKWKREVKEYINKNKKLSVNTFYANDEYVQ